MYKYNEITNVNLELTEKCNSKCLLCSRYLINGNINPNLNNREILISDIKRIFNDIDFIKQLETLTICGNYGEPICNDDLIEIISYFKKYNNSIIPAVRTNGSLRKPSFWKKLAQLNVCGEFAIDGLEDTSNIYRENTSFNKVIENANAFIQAGGYATWDYIVFEHNEHQVDEAKMLSEKMGFKKFNIVKTNRLDNRVNIYSHLRKPKSEKYKNPTAGVIGDKEITKYLNQTKIKCIFGNLNSIFLSAEKLIFPCCWMASIKNYGDHTPEITEKLKTFFKNINEISTDFYSIEKILEGDFFKKIKESWTKKSIADGKLSTCSYQCADGNSPFLNQFY